LPFKTVVMKRQVLFPDVKPGVQFFWLVAFILFFMLVFSALGLVAGTFLYGRDLSSLAEAVVRPATASDRSFILFFQFLNQLGFLFFPVLLFVLLFTSRDVSYLKMNRISLGLVLLAGVSVYSILPVINWLGDLNQQMTFPSWLAGMGDWMRARETQADRITAFLLQVKSPQGLLANLVIIALIPAVGEELLFRGLVQRLLNAWTRSIPVGVLLTAILFSAIHFQFFGFLPRFFLGLMLGILLEITQSLWAPVFAHFVNNATLVILYYLHSRGTLSIDPEQFGSSSHVYILFLSLAVTAYIFYRIKTLREKKILSHSSHFPEI